MTLDARGASRRTRDPETDPRSFFESPIRVKRTTFRGDLDARSSWFIPFFSSAFPSSYFPQQLDSSIVSSMTFASWWQGRLIQTREERDQRDDDLGSDRPGPTDSAVSRGQPALGHRANRTGGFFYPETVSIELSRLILTQGTVGQGKARPSHSTSSSFSGYDHSQGFYDLIACGCAATRINRVLLNTERKSQRVGSCWEQRKFAIVKTSPTAKSIVSAKLFSKHFFINFYFMNNIYGKIEKYLLRNNL